MCSHEVCASNTRSRGASKTLVMRISLSDGVVTMSLLPLPPIALLLSSSLELIQVLLQPVVAFLPETPVPLRPRGDLLQRSRLEPGWPPLPLATPGDEPRSLQHLQVLRDGRQAHLERFRQLRHRGLPRRQPRQDRPPRGIREGREGAVQPTGCRGHSTLQLNNCLVNYCRSRCRVKSRFSSSASGHAVGYLEGLVDDLESFRQLLFGDTERRVCHDRVPPADRVQPLIEKRAHHCHHLLARAVERRERFHGCSVAHELDDPEEPEVTNGPHRWMAGHQRLIKIGRASCRERVC